MDGRDLSCSLEGPELLARIQDWKKLAARARTRSLEGNGVVSVYPKDSALLAELNRLIEAEKECCSFMEFRVQEGPEEIVVRLEVPKEMAHMLELMVGIATDAREPSSV